MLQNIAQIVATVAGMMNPAVSIVQNIAEAWQSLKPLIGHQVIPPDPTPQQLADLDTEIHSLALAAHAAWHAGDAPIAPLNPQE